MSTNTATQSRHSTSRPSRPGIWLRIYALGLLLLGILFFGGGAWLAALGGSWYYLATGLALLAAGALSYRGRIEGLWIYLAALAGTAAWALWEVGLDFWALVPRTVAPIALAFVGLALAPSYRKADGTRAGHRLYELGALASLAGFAAFVALMLQPHGVVRNSFDPAPGTISEVTTNSGNDWSAYGRTGEGTRFAPLAQITPKNAKDLQVAWTYEHEGAKEQEEDQNTPLFIKDTLYYCSPTNAVTALDASTGKEKWKFDPKSQSPFWKRCRSLGYYQPPQANDSCGARVLVATVDGRLISIRASDGKPCESFGEKGTVDLKAGMGEVPAGFYMLTTGAMVAGDRVILGGWVADNVSVNEPSGVIRAFDAGTGTLDWAWDLGNPETTRLPKEGESYTRGTPNAWGPMAYDLKLGSVFVPMGNATPDYWGGERREFDDKYASSIVALDLETGRPKWHFQTVHHDIWDYDIASQPALFDVPDGKGGTIPALIQLTKRGQIFMLDRRTGEPIAEVQEKPVPAGHAEGERYSPTQPYSVGMPAIGTERPSEARTWGMTPLDHLLCRINFKRHHYEGDFTPPRFNELAMQFPGNYGGMNWGSASIDHGRNLLLVNDLRMAVSTRLEPRAKVDAMGLDPHGIYSKMIGTPYGMYVDNFVSPLGVPCMQPPFGTLSAIDLASRKLVWQVPVGTVKNTGPLGLQLGIPLLPGMPTLGGSVSTSGGVVFFSGTQDYYLRAFDTETGEELWKGALPTGSQATPITYMDEKTGRQMVVVTAAGAPHNPNDRRKSYVMAFALPAR